MDRNRDERPNLEARKDIINKPLDLHSSVTNIHSRKADEEQYCDSVKANNVKPLSDWIREHEERKAAGKKRLPDVLPITVIIALLLCASIAIKPLFIGKVIGESPAERDTILVDKFFTKTETYSLTLKGNITSLRATGKFMGNGTGRIILDGKVIADTRRENSYNHITGLVTDGLAAQMIFTGERESSNELANDTPTNAHEHISGFEDTFNDSLILSNTTRDNEGNLPEENNSYRPDQDKSATPLIIFNNFCLETCFLDNLPGEEIELVIELDGVTLNLTSIEYTYIESLEIEYNDTGNMSMLNTSDNTSEAEVVSVVEINSPVKWSAKAENGRSVRIPAEAFRVSSDAEDDLEITINGKKISVKEYNKVASSNRMKRKLKDSESSSTQEELEAIKKTASTGSDMLDELAVEAEEAGYADVAYNGTEPVEITYFTEGPTATEQILDSSRKIVIVNSSYHFENVLAYTAIDEAQEDAITVYWVKDSGKEVFTDVTYIDTNGNGLIDRLEWTIPHLSEQVFEISIRVLNPYTYLRDGETWTVAFETTGIGNLTISSPNAGWTEFRMDNMITPDEMSFLDIMCGNSSVAERIMLVDNEGDIYSYAALGENDSVSANKLIIPDYECNETAYLSNYMITAGYATIMFEFSNENASVTDIAYDPSLLILGRTYVAADVCVRDSSISDIDYESMTRWDISSIPDEVTIDEVMRSQNLIVE